MLHFPYPIRLLVTRRYLNLKPEDMQYCKSCQFDCAHTLRARTLAIHVTPYDRELRVGTGRPCDIPYLH